MKGGRKFLIQVKSGTSSASRSEIKKLRSAARGKGAKALLIHANGRKIKSRFVY